MAKKSASWKKEEKIRQAARMFQGGAKKTEIANIFGVSPHTITNWSKGAIWKQELKLTRDESYQIDLAEFSASHSVKKAEKKPKKKEKLEKESVEENTRDHEAELVVLEDSQPQNLRNERIGELEKYHEQITQVLASQLDNAFRVSQISNEAISEIKKTYPEATVQSRKLNEFAVINNLNSIQSILKGVFDAYYDVYSIKRLLDALEAKNELVKGKGIS